MRNYPHPGERWQHERGWTVTIIRLIEASPSVALVNPEFSCEVLIRHDSDNQLSSCPLTLHPSVLFIRWRERSIRRSAEPDDGHYSKFL